MSKKIGKRVVLPRNHLIFPRKGEQEWQSAVYSEVRMESISLLLLFNRSSFSALVRNGRESISVIGHSKRSVLWRIFRLSSGDVIGGVVATMANRYTDLINDIRDLYRDWQDGNLGGKDFEARKTSIGNRILGRRLCEE